MLADNQKAIVRYILLASVIWLLLSGLVLLYGQVLLIPLLHYFEFIAEQFSQGFSVAMSAGKVKSEAAIIMTVTTTENILTAANDVLVPKGVSTSIFAHSLNVLVPVIILFSLILAYPVSSLKEFLVMFLSAIIFAIIILLSTVPFQLLGIMENHLKSIADAEQQQYTRSLIHYWQVFCDGGGVWMLAVIAAIASIALARWQRQDVNSQSLNQRA